MNKKLYFVFTAALIVILFFTNPGEEEHKSEVFNRVSVCVKEIIAKKTKNDSSQFSFWGATLRNVLVEPIVLNLTQNLVFVENYYLFSITKINFNNQQSIVGVGLLGKVLISSKLEEHMNQVADDYLDN